MSEQEMPEKARDEVKGLLTDFADSIINTCFEELVQKKFNDVYERINKLGLMVNELKELNKKEQVK